MKKRSNLKIMLKLSGLVRPLAGWMACAVLMGVTGFLCSIMIPVLGGYGILDAVNAGSPFTVKTVCIIVGTLALLRGILRYGEQACNHYIAFRLLALIRHKVFAALRKLCPAKLEGKDRGNLISVITSDIELLEVFYAHTISPVVIAAVMSLAMTFLIGRYHWLAGLIVLCGYVTVGAAVPLMISRRSGSVGMEFRKGSGELSSFVLDSLRGLKESQQYGTGEKRLSELENKTDRLSEKQERMSSMTGRNMALTNTLILIVDFLQLGVCAWLYLDGRMGFDGLLISVIATMSSFGPVIALANLGSTLQNTFAAGNRVLDILEETPQVAGTAGKEKTVFSGAGLEKVTFGYGDELVLQDVSLQVKPGKITGIVGRSGSGKSTMLKLLMRFWDAREGRVEISGKDIRQVNASDLREMEGYMTQETHLFHDSIAANLRIAKLSASREELEEACRKASIHDFIMTLPNGYDTEVGELGETLSGGERQRLGLARAFLHDAPLLLLDEPTSNLDSLNEAVILKSLRDQQEERSVVLVSHRASTMNIADQVYQAEELSGKRSC